MEVAINYLSVLLAAVAIYGVGFLWYGPLLGKHWMKLMGQTPESLKNMNMSPKKAMALAGLGALIAAFVLALLVRLLNPIGIGGAFMTALLIWTGFIAPITANAVLFEGRSWKLYLFNLAEQFVALLVAALILVLWP